MNVMHTWVVVSSFVGIQAMVKRFHGEGDYPKNQYKQLTILKAKYISLLSIHMLRMLNFKYILPSTAKIWLKRCS